MLWIAVFMLVDRIRHKPATPALKESLATCVERSLEQVNHQIGLLKNVLWWYLLPPGAAILLCIGYCAWSLRVWPWWVEILVLGCMGLFAAFLYGVYWLNQREVRTKLRPRQQELQALLDCLKACEG
jgi:hypothetical protein